MSQPVTALLPSQGLLVAALRVLDKAKMHQVLAPGYACFICFVGSSDWELWHKATAYIPRLLRDEEKKYLCLHHYGVFNNLSRHSEGVQVKGFMAVVSLVLWFSMYLFGYGLPRGYWQMVSIVRRLNKNTLQLKDLL